MSRSSWGPASTSSHHTHTHTHRHITSCCWQYADLSSLNSSLTYVMLVTSWFVYCLHASMIFPPYHRTFLCLSSWPVWPPCRALLAIFMSEDRRPHTSSPVLFIHVCLYAYRIAFRDGCRRVVDVISPSSLRSSFCCLVCSRVWSIYMAYSLLSPNPNNPETNSLP